MVTLETSKNKIRDAQKGMEGDFKELNYNRLALNDLYSDFDGAQN